MGGNGFAASVAKLPGIVMALGGAIGFAVGTVLAKKLPLNLPPMSGRRLADRDRLLAGRDRRASLIEKADLAGIVRSRTGCCWSIRPWSSSASPMSLVCGAGAAAGVGGGDRHHGGAGDRRGGFGGRAARAARPRPDRGADLHACRRRAGDAVLGPCLHGIGSAIARGRARLLLTTAKSALGVKGLRRQTVAPSSSVIVRKSGAGGANVAQA